ncbi:MAG: hypothetical protein ACRBBW_18430 [Cellvibrionaceae bacterium]
MKRCRAPTQVSITIDTEFSIAGHFSSPELRKPIAEPLVYGHTASGQQGLGFMLETFSHYNTEATFFVETANTRYFGDEPMARVVRDIQQAQQDIQLHIHPVWLSFSDDRTEAKFPRQDSCSGQGYSDLKRVFNVCIDSFKRLTGKAPVAIRTGNLQADSTTYKVMHDLDIGLSSNIATGIFKPCEKKLQLDSGRHSIEGVTEVPVLTYQDFDLFGKQHQKSLQITSCSWPEMKRILIKARDLGIEQVVILTHPFEFFKSSDSSYRRIIRNRVNQNRLSELCRFIKDHDQDFASASFGNNLETWQHTTHREKLLKMPNRYALARKIHNKINDSIWYY